MPPRRSSRRRPQRVTSTATAGQSSLSTWTVTRLRRELKDNHGIEADSWLKKSGLIALLRRAIADPGRRTVRVAPKTATDLSPWHLGVRRSMHRPARQPHKRTRWQRRSPVSRPRSRLSSRPDPPFRPSQASRPARNREPQGRQRQMRHSCPLPRGSHTATPTRLRQPRRVYVIARRRRPSPGFPVSARRPKARQETRRASPAVLTRQRLEPRRSAARITAPPASFTPGRQRQRCQASPFHSVTALERLPPAAPSPPASPTWSGQLGCQLTACPYSIPISPSLRSDILAGKNINLATLLIPGFKPQDEVTERSLVMGEDIVPLKPLTDQRLHRPLTITEFVKAFTIYKKIMCEAYPERHDELDSYLHEIVDMATRYPGLIF